MNKIYFKRVLIFLFAFNIFLVTCAQEYYNLFEPEPFDLKVAIFKGQIDRVEKLLNEDVDTDEALSDLVYAMLSIRIKNIVTPAKERERNQRWGLDSLVLDYDNAEKILKLLLKYGVDINSGLTIFESAIFKAVRFGCLPAVKLLIKYGVNVNPPEDKYHRTPILYIMYGATLDSFGVEILDELIKAGADINKTTHYGETVLMDTACRYSFKDPVSQKVIFRLLFHGANMTLESYWKTSFFHQIYLASAILDVTKYFVQYILNTDNPLVSIKGAQNALLIAAYLNEPESVRALLNKGVWFNSNTYEQYFNNLIADKPAIKAIVNQYHLAKDPSLPNFEFIKYLF